MVVGHVLDEPLSTAGAIPTTALVRAARKGTKNGYLSFASSLSYSRSVQIKHMF